MAGTREPFLLLLRAGPVWNIREVLAFLAESFAKYYDGHIVTYSRTPQKMHLGRFRITAHHEGADWIPPAVRRSFYVVRVVAHGLWIRWIRRRPLIVITYDPLLNGLIGVALRWLAGAIFICEVNGVYGHPDTLIDIPDRRQAAGKRRRMRRVASFVLRRAHLIKLLYPEQLVGLSVPTGRPPRESFHDAVNSAEFEPRGLAPERRLLFVGHPYLLKGVDLLLEAFARVSGDFPEWRLLVVGWQIEQSARAAGAAHDRVDFLGPQKRDDLRALMERSAGLVLPSRSEGMGRVLLEAAFLGRPRIGSRAGGIPWVIEDRVDGLLFNSGDVDDLERVLRRFFGATDEERRDLGRAARSRALASFSLDEFAVRYRRIIDRLTLARAEGRGSLLK